jgi:hypothetical protein
MKNNKHPNADFFTLPPDVGFHFVSHSNGFKIDEATGICQREAEKFAVPGKSLPDIEKMKL